MPRFGTGHPNARVMLVGECFTEEESRKGEAFLGTSGEELNKLLHECGILRSECYTTNLVNSWAPGATLDSWIPIKKKDIRADMVAFKGRYVAPEVVRGYERLMKEIELIQPNIIICFGNAALWALTGAVGIMKWRGSQLTLNGLSRPFKVIPTYHPSTMNYAPDNRNIISLDLRRARKEIGSAEYRNVPDWKFLVRPSFETVVETLQTLQSYLAAGQSFWLDFDLETRAGHIACAGISWSLTDALCIPFMCVESRDGYWTLEEEAAIVFRLYKLLTHPLIKVRGQNLLYDAQYTYRHWHFVPRVIQDTMISHHTMWAGLPKKLDFQASMYCDHYVYWKDDGKTWTESVGEDQLWSYNCIDCVRTREVGEVELRSIETMGLQEVEAFQQRFFWPVLAAMQKGVRIDKDEKRRLDTVLEQEIDRRVNFLAQICGHPLNPASPTQMVKFFYEDLKIQPVMTRAKKGAPSRVTCDDEALKVIMKREPILKPVVEIIEQIRSLRVFLSTFVRMPLDYDGRMRCSYNICGTETYRLNSSKNAFGSGGNLQNIPKGDEE